MRKWFGCCATRCVREAPWPRPSRCHPHLPTTLRRPLFGPSHHPALALFLFLSALARSLQASFSFSIEMRSCTPQCVYPAAVRWLWGVPCLYPAFSRAHVFTPWPHHPAPGHQPTPLLTHSVPQIHQSQHCIDVSHIRAHRHCYQPRGIYGATTYVCQLSTGSLQRLGARM